MLNQEHNRNAMVYFRIFCFCFLCFLFSVVVPQGVFSQETVAMEAVQNIPIDELRGLNKTLIDGDGTTQMQVLIGLVIKYIVGFLGTLALCIIIYSGVRFMVSQGNEETQKKSLAMILWASIGITALLGSYSLVRFVFGIL
jgi:hypothetical protein